MRRLLKFFLFGLFLLSFAAVTPAQKFIAHVSTPEQHRSRSWSEPWGGWNQSWGGFRHHTRSYSFFDLEPTIGYAHGDSDWVPSVYMDYDKAVALGKELLDQQSQPHSDPPLGDIARKLRESASQETPGGKPLSVTQESNRQ
jgi:hypothetical protein